MFKHIVAKHIIREGDTISEDDICVKRSENGLPASAWDIIIGTKARKTFNIDEGIEI